MLLQILRIINHLIIRSMQGAKRPLCKFGANCNRLQTGQCNFYHPPNQLANMGNMGGSGGMNNPKPYYGNQPNSFIHHQNKPQNYPKQNDNGNFYANNNNYNNQGFKEKSNDVFFVLCRNFHIGQACQYPDNCKKKHYFIVNDEHAIRRFNYLKNLPNNLVSKLTKFKSANKDYFALRNGNTINFFDINIQTKALNDVFTWNLPELPQNLKYNYYDHKGDYIYYSFPNPQTMIEDISLFHIPTQKTVHIANSHSGRVTGMAHFNENVILTTTIAGQLKVWLKEGETYVAHPDSTQKLRSSFNPQNLKLELLFLDISEVNGAKIIAVGTNDSRLLFFIGNDLNFHQVVFKQDLYAKIYAVRYTTRPGNPSYPCAIVLAWNNNNPNTTTTLLEINLNNFQQQVLVQNVNGQDVKSNNSICYFQLIDNYLMAGTIGGEVSIYRYPDTTQKVGCIFLQNTINDIVYCEQALKNTGTKIKYMLVLERKTEKKEGSLGFYILN